MTRIALVTWPMNREGEMNPNDWTAEIELLRRQNVDLDAGLRDAEFRRVEDLYRFRFPPDLRSFLEAALPISQRFPNWRAPDSRSVVDQMSWPFEGIAIDISNGTLWLPTFGARPPESDEAVEIARKEFERAPRLIALYGHRYLPAEPALEGNPVFSVYQSDIICYGNDLRRYLACEFGTLSYDDAVRGKARRVPLWSDLVERNQ